MYISELFDEVRAANLQARIPANDEMGLADVVQQLVDIEATERNRRGAFTCRYLSGRLIPDTIDQLAEPVEVSEARICKQLIALAALGILRCGSDLGDRLVDRGDWLPVYRLADR